MNKFFHSNIYLVKIISLIYLLVVSGLYVGSVSALTGTILATSTSHTAQSLVCKDSACLVGNSGLLNWRPTAGGGVTAVSIDDSLGLSGHVWGSQMGWINLKPTGQGVVVNTTSGVLSGYAWSSTCGWVNFAPTNYGVSILTDTAETSGGAGTVVGKFEGYAWCGGEAGGWIKFACIDPNACVKTNWVKTADRYVAPTSGGGGGGGGGGGFVVSGATLPTTAGQIVSDSNYSSQTGPQNQLNGDYTALYRSDIDDKGVVDIFDFNLLMVNWAKKTTIDMTKPKPDRCKTVNVADVNCDGLVNILDFNTLMVNWAKRLTTTQ